jgi:hypothetical protein
MGMYDYVDILVSCPVCGNTVRNAFQTKDFENVMDHFRPGDNVGTKHRPKFVHTYTTCDHERKITRVEGELILVEVNGLWIEYDIPIVDGIITTDMNLWTRRTEPTSYNALSGLPEDVPRDNIEERAIDRVNRANAKIRRDILITKWEQTHTGKAPIR